MGASGRRRGGGGLSFMAAGTRATRLGAPGRLNNTGHVASSLVCVTRTRPEPGARGIRAVIWASAARLLATISIHAGQGSGAVLCPAWRTAHQACRGTTSSRGCPTGPWPGP